jgi:DNA-binding MarR family transcriptional regulator
LNELEKKLYIVDSSAVRAITRLVYEGQIRVQVATVIEKCRLVDRLPGNEVQVRYKN